MPRDRLIVLKFGGSVLHDDRDLRNAVHEINRWRRDGWRVVAVVSALEGTTDRLLSHARALGDNPEPHALAALLATGELHSAALLGLALDNAGIPARVLDHAAISLRTQGAPTDASPVSLDAASVHSSLEESGVVVLPGFIGRDNSDRTTLLGRGGSDLSGLFIAHHLGADRVRLVKDVDALYDRDPRTALPNNPAQRFTTLHWNDALALDGNIVQHKAVRFAQSYNLPFEVATLHRDDASIVGDHPACLTDPSPDQPPLRVALLGTGTVGLGVYNLLTELPNHFQITSVCVRNIDKAIASAIRADLLTTDPFESVNADCDAVIELLGGTEPARTLIEHALTTGRHVITANKAVIAAHHAHLSAIAETSGVTLSCSAAVGGAAPMIESVRRIAAEQPIRSLQGVLNGTCNFILSAISTGESFNAALARAQSLGYAEADPSRDLDGRDAADKLAIIILEAWGIAIDPRDIQRTPLTAALVTELQSTPNAIIRQVARAHRTDDAICATVSPEIVAPDHPLAHITNEWNRLIITTESGTHTVTGKGAGRFPTAQSVTADLLDLWRSSAPVPITEGNLA